jgi:hypothetical protein
MSVDSCTRARDLMMGAEAEALGPDESSELERHLAECAACREHRDELLSLTIADVRPPEEVERLMANIRSAKAPRGMQHSGIWEHVRKNGSRFRVEVTSHGLDFEGRDARLVMMRPVTPA